MAAFSAYALVLLLGLIIVVAVRKAPMTALGRPLISAYTVMLGLFALYLFMPAVMLLVLEGGEYVWLPSYGGYENIALTAFVSVAALACFLGAYWLRQRASLKVVEFAAFNSPTQIAKALAWTMIIFGVLLKIYTVFVAGGVQESAIRLSAGVRDSVGVEELSSVVVIIRYLSGVADASIVWIILHQLRSKRLNAFPYVVLLIVLGLSFFGTGKRLFLLWPLVAVAIGFHYYVRPLRVNLAPTAMAAIMVAGFASLMFRIYLPAQAADIEINLYHVRWANGSLLSFYFLSLEFGTFEVLTLAIKNSENIIRLFSDPINAFYVTNIQPISYFVPRIFWPGKPDVLIDMSHAYRVFVLGGDLTSGGGIAGTLTATSWTLGGPIGVAIAMLLLGYLAAALDAVRRVVGRPSPMGVIWYAFGIVVVFHLFRQGTLGWVVLIVVFQQIGMLLAFSALGILDRVPAQEARRTAARRG